MLDQLNFQMDHHTADLEPGNILPAKKAGKLVMSAVSGGRISMSRAVENLFLVAAGIRGTSMFHPVDVEEILIVHELAEKLGLGMVVRKCGTLVYKVFIFGSRERIIEIPDIYESIGFRKFIIGQIAIARMSGSILDFPECCVESFVNHLMQGTDQDLAATEALRIDLDPDPEAYFVERFVPCTPGCRKAASIGRKITEDLRRINPELAGIYGKLKREHLEEIKSGSIVEEKTLRNKQLTE